jgi:cystathionine beta-lyase/cystathionine gamma-synthase
VDVVVHSASKYLGGHSDLMAGAVVTTAERLERIFYRSYLLNGGILGPSDAWLLLRSLRTLPARMRQHEADGISIAQFLARHPAVRRVHHPAFARVPTAAEAGLTGFSGLFSFELSRGGFEAVQAVIDGLRRFRIGVSWGGTESLVLSPHRRGNEAELEARGIPPGLVRLAVGLEGAEPLIEDLAAALDRLA